MLAKKIASARFRVDFRLTCPKPVELGELMVILAKLAGLADNAEENGKQGKLQALPNQSKELVIKL